MFEQKEVVSRKGFLFETEVSRKRFHFRIEVSRKRCPFGFPFKEIRSV